MTIDANYFYAALLAALFAATFWNWKRRLRADEERLRQVFPTIGADSWYGKRDEERLQTVFSSPRWRWIVCSRATSLSPRAKDQ
jgi:hypothetical protein